MRKKRPDHRDTIVSINGKDIPLRIYTEFRSNVRVSLGKDFVILRIPSFVSGATERHLLFARQWLETLSIKKPAALNRYDTAKYDRNFSFTVLGLHVFQVEVLESDRASGLAEMIDGEHIRISIPQEGNPVNKKKMIRTLISRIVAKKFKKQVEERVAFWNDKYFSRSIKKVYLKYNATNWGSCSVDSNINLSTRSLLLPPEVFDYIIVHELSHLIEMNHSGRYWQVVKSVMPDFEKHEEWLRKNGGKLDF